jgi:hypothetical protein
VSKARAVAEFLLIGRVKEQRSAKLRGAKNWRSASLELPKSPNRCVRRGFVDF